MSFSSTSNPFASHAQTVLSAKTQELNQAAVEKQKLADYIQALQETLKAKEIELQQEQKKVTELEAKNQSVSVPQKEQTCGASTGWGSSSGWGNSGNKEHTVEEEKLW